MVHGAALQWAWVRRTAVTTFPACRWRPPRYGSTTLARFWGICTRTTWRRRRGSISLISRIAARRLRPRPASFPFPIRVRCSIQVRLAIPKHSLNTTPYFFSASLFIAHYFVTGKRDGCEIFRKTKDGKAEYLLYALNDWFCLSFCIRRGSLYSYSDRIDSSLRSSL